VVVGRTVWVGCVTSRISFDRGACLVCMAARAALFMCKKCVCFAIDLTRLMHSFLLLFYCTVLIAAHAFIIFCRLLTNSPVEERILARATDKKNLNGLVVEAGRFNVRNNNTTA